MSIIMNDAVLRAVALGPDGVLAGARPGSIVVDLSTVSPAASADVGAAARERGVGYLCGKVAGSVGLAESAGLTLFASGDADDFGRCRPAFEAMAANVHHVGEGDAAAYLKLVHSLIVGVYAAMIGEALTFGQRGGLSLGTMLDILEAGPLGSHQLTLKAPILKERRFDSPPSDVDTAAKDVDLILDAARKDAVPLPLTVGGAAGHGDGPGPRRRQARQLLGAGGVRGARRPRRCETTVVSARLRLPGTSLDVSRLCLGGNRLGGAARSGRVLRPARRLRGGRRQLRRHRSCLRGLAAGRGALLQREDHRPMAEGARGRTAS